MAPDLRNGAAIQRYEHEDAMSVASERLSTIEVLLRRGEIELTRRTLAGDCALGALLTAVVVGLTGCGRHVEPRFTASKDVTDLTADAQTDEEKKLWQDLQEQINATLAARCGTPLAPKPLDGSGLDADELALGAVVFQHRCAPCHGTNGDGKGTVAKYLKPLPRDYRQGIFKFTSTPYGSKPRRADLIRTITRGVTGTSMPSFADLPPNELNAVADYVIYLSQRGELERELVNLAQEEEALDDEFVDESADMVTSRWKEVQQQLVMPVTPMPPMTDETIAKGQALFLGQACNKCHGVDGRGGSLGNVEVGQDAWGHKAAAADLTSGMFHGGGRPIDIYRRIYSGINGTPMPAFADKFAKSPDDIWYLVHFIRDVGERRRRNLPPVETSTSTAPAGTLEGGERDSQEQATEAASNT